MSTRGNLPTTYPAHVSAADVVDASVAVEQSRGRLTAIVAQARAQGLTWQQIGDALGMTRQGAQQQYGA